MAICVIAVVGVAPCQCFSPGANQTTSPGRISSTGPPSRCAQPSPEVTINVWPNGCVCHAVRAPGSNVTLAPRTHAGSGASNSGSIRTVPVNQSEDPILELCESALLISISFLVFQPFSFSPIGCEPLLLISISQPLKFDRLQPRKALPQSSRSRHLQRSAFLSRRFIFFALAIRLSISVILRCASNRHRRNAGVPLPNPWKRCLISSIRNPARLATSMTSK